LIAGEIDLAVHSAKDLPTLLPGGLAIVAALRAKIRAMCSSVARPRRCARWRLARLSHRVAAPAGAGQAAAARPQGRYLPR